MEENKVLSSSMTPTKDQEKAVCGTGKHRVININPMLLTPISASKIYPHRSETANTNNPTSESVSKETIDIFTQSSPSSNSMPMPTHSVSDSEGTEAADIASISEVSNVSHDVKSDLKPHHSVFQNSSDFYTLQNAEKFSTVPLNQPRVFTSARHERTIEISPSLLLPVTAMPSNNHTLTSNVSSGKTQPKGIFSSASRTTISASSSLSDLPGSRLSITEDIDGLSTFSEAQDSILTSCTEGIPSDVEKLKESLRLADADIAILVSSKQQLQLDLHREAEQVKALSNQLVDSETKYQDAMIIVEDLRRTLEQKQKIFKSEMENMQGHLQHSTAEMELLRQSLDTAQASEASHKMEIDLLQHLSEQQQVKAQRIEKELNNASNKNRELERLLREATAKDEGIESFVRHLNEVKNDVSIRLQDKVMECEKLQIENKMLGAKIADVEHTNGHLMEKSSKHEKRFRETDAENIKLQSRLSVETREKIDLNSAVAKLRSDLGNVQSSFQKLKKQFLDKAAAAQNEATRRSELEVEVKSLTAQISKLTNVNAEMRIRDKNIQIEQLLTQSRTSTQERSKLENSIKELQEHIDSNEKSWVKAVQQEKTLQRSLKEKDDVVCLKTHKIEELEAERKNDQNEILDLKKSLENHKKSVSTLEISVKEKEQNLVEVLQREQTLLTKISVLQNEISDKTEQKQEADKKHQKHIGELVQNSKHLSEEIDRLQQSLVMKQEEIKSVGLLKESNRKHESEAGNMEQLQLLSELQSTRRELSHQIETLQREKDGLESSLKVAESKISNLEQVLLQEKQLSDITVAKLNESKNTMGDEFKDRIENLYEKLKQSEEVKKLLGNELKDTKEMNQSLSHQTSLMESETKKLREEITDTEQEAQEAKVQLKRSKEELELVKSELSNVMMQLSEVVNQSDTTSDKYVAEIDKLQNECVTLRSAVVRQQEYCVSLQKHYQEWAKEAEEKMRFEVTEARRKSEESQSKLTEMIKSQPKEEKIEDGSGDKQLTCHLNHDVSSSYESNAAHITQTMDSITQTEDSGVVQNNDDVLEKYNREISLLVEEKIQLLQENTQQAETIAALEGRIGIESSTERTRLADFASQTSIEQMSIPNYPDDETLLEDASTQTEDSIQYAHIKKQDFGEERRNFEAMRNEFERHVTVQSQENAKLRQTIRLLESNLSDLKHSHSYMLEDCSTQTSHDDIPIILPGYEDNSGTLLEDGATQTDHDDMTVIGANQELDSLKEKLSDSKLQVNMLSATVDELNEKNITLTSYINDLRNSSKLTSVPQDISANNGVGTTSEKKVVSKDYNSVVNGAPCEKDNDSTLRENNNSENKTLSNTSLPSPMTILQTIESKKLKAYKKTVAVLKKQLKDANKNIKTLQAEMKVLLEHRSLHSKDTDVDKVSVQPEKNFERELYDAKKQSALHLEEVKRKSLADKKKLELKVTKMSERLDGLTEANRELRMSVEYLQVKLTERTRQSDIATKEKNRYQMRARRLQASLRSLAWINGNQDKSLFISDDLLLDDSVPESIGADSSADIQEVPSETGSELKSPGLDTSKNSLPASVVEIEASLKDLQSEIIALERQMQEHNTAVKKSKNQWTRLKQESQSHQPNSNENDSLNNNSNDAEIV